MIMKVYIKFITFVSLLKFYSAKLPDLDERCFLIANGEPGICKLVNDCPAALALFETDGILPQACTPNNTDIVVCCSSNATVISSPTVLPLTTMLPLVTPPSVTIPQILSKCQEYNTGNECGMSPLSKRLTKNRFALINDYPHAAKIIYKLDGNDSAEFFDNDEGSLISSRYVLSAASILTEPGRTPVKVLFGNLTVSLEAANKSMLDYDIENIIVHPDYQSTSLRNDIALIKVSKRIIFSNSVRPICLPDTDYSPLNDIVYRINYEQQLTENQSRPLVKYQRRLITNDICNVTYLDNKLSGGFDENFICTTPMELPDSNYEYRFDGAAIAIDHPNVTCARVLLGVSIAIEESRIADAALNVYNYREWIENIVWADDEYN